MVAGSPVRRAPGDPVHRPICPAAASLGLPEQGGSPGWPGVTVLSGAKGREALGFGQSAGLAATGPASWPPPQPPALAKQASLGSPGPALAGLPGRAVPRRRASSCGGSLAPGLSPPARGPAWGSLLAPGSSLLKLGPLWFSRHTCEGAPSPGVTWERVDGAWRGQGPTGVVGGAGGLRAGVAASGSWSKPAQHEGAFLARAGSGPAAPGEEAR